MSIHPLKIGENKICEIANLPVEEPIVFWEDPEAFANKFLLTDGVHLNGEGHSMLALALIRKIISHSSFNS